MADPMKCIVKIANKANLSETITRIAMNMMTQIIKKGNICWKKSDEVLAEACYFIFHPSRLRKIYGLFHITKVAGITEVTIRNRIHELNSTVL